MSDHLPQGPLVAYYGDDYTGSAAVMEVMTFAGLPTVLFLDVPTPMRLARFRAYRGIGIAGVARSQPPEWMDEHLPPIFRALYSIGAPISHYKVCSTFDSSPTTGSIAARSISPSRFSAAAGIRWPWPPRRSNATRPSATCLPASAARASGSIAIRPMAHHPVTPMHEADVRLHLVQQTRRRIGLVDFIALQQDRGAAEWRGNGRRAPRSSPSTSSTRRHWRQPAA